MCLIGVLMLWAPMLASAWATSGMACCAGNMCAAHAHGKTNSTGKSKAARNEAPMECEHSRGQGWLPARCPAVMKRALPW